ncbi:MAG: sterol desaturase family protein, partial [Gammaproteobacteria bacterium]
IYVVGGLLVKSYNIKGKLVKLQPNKIPKPGQNERDFKQSIYSLLTISTFLAGGITLNVYGYTLFPVSTTSWPYIVGEILISLFLFDTWFYWFHRLIHHKFFFRYVHAWHHYSSTPTVWSNNSDSFLDNCFLQSYWLLAPVVLPFSPLVFLIHKAFDQITGMLGHAGYEYSGKLALYPSPLLSTTHHDLHHSAIRCNYATHFSIWDRLMGTLHPNYDQLFRENLLQKTNNKNHE